MEQKSPFGSFLEELEDFRAPLIDWKDAMYGKHDISDFRHAFLSSTDEYAKAIRCPTQCDSPCPMRIQHKEKSIEAVCGENISNNQPLSEQDILIYRLNVSKLHKIIAMTFGINLNENNLNDKRRYYLGEYTPFAGINYPVYMSYCNFRASMSGMVKYLCSGHHGKFILFSTSRRFLTPETELLLKKREIVFVSLEDELLIDRRCNVSLRRGQEKIFASLLNMPETKTVEFFPTPLNAKWEDLNIHFINEHTVTVQILETKASLNYFEMGMASSLNKGPVDRWTFMLNLAENYGVYGWDGLQASPAIKKQKQLLCENLVKFFRIEGEPIYWDEGRKAYIARFQIRPDTYSTSWKGKGKKLSV
ncbi:MAG: hypothetical protein UT30_C0008G0004 [Candidatus Uhrbacteria bacterium GW2011_GWF2_39_13]|uniref:Uncharacterized protein n=1 Tax=Candidatus Uhrbacteria bacterium GW2011_GWF2_39_13 TaxID=1618995 RepID=A0A0G0QRW2_9BACT|nr:MAG: hypothetical protein UT30_C0008G0004 [Candidatus Uhrbacteria bacterium GW2011_GWF2_39_13]